MTAVLFSTNHQPATTLALQLAEVWSLLPQMPEAEEAFWHAQYMFEPYFVAGRGFDQYSPAYLLGW